MNLVTMKVKDVKRNKDNPPIRTDRDNKFKKLLTSVSKYGLISPIVVSSNNVLINGTRRLAVHKDLGKKTIKAIRHNSDSHLRFDEYFVESNVVEVISGSQWAWRYLRGASVPSKIRSVCVFLKKVGGEACLHRMIELKKSPVSFAIGVSMFRNYTGNMSNTMAKKVIYWMLYVDSAYRLKSLIGEYVPMQILVNAIKEKKQIVHSSKGWTLK
tara:strand:- start:1005 stop:1643 length:639 start_codon:yes stop_codon:yes gene_type:complete